MTHTRKLVLSGTLGGTLLLALIAARVFDGNELSAQANQAPQAPVFEVDPLWPKPLPNRWLLGSAVGVATDSRNNVYVLHLTNSFNARTEIGAASNPPTGECCTPAPAVLVFDPQGNLLRSWGGPGEGYSWPLANHGLAVDNQGNVWIAGSGPTDTHILKFSGDGKFQKLVGTIHVPSTTLASGRAAGDTAYTGVSAAAQGRGRAGGRGAAAGPPPLPPDNASLEKFGGAAEISIDAAANEAFVADGYRNRRVAVIDLNSGAIKRVWGAYGNKPDNAVTAAYDPAAPASKQFGTPVRCAELSRDGLVYVCDRSNNRIQVFRKDGTFVKEKVIAPRTRGEGAVWDLTFSRDAQQRFVYVADGLNMKVHILDRQSLDVLTSFGDGGRQPGQFFAVHSITTDSQGNIYTTETYEGKRVQKFLFKGLAPVKSPNAGVVWPRRGEER